MEVCPFIIFQVVFQSIGFYFIKINYLLFHSFKVGVGGDIVDVTSGFLSGRVQRVVIDCIISENIKMVSGVPEGIVLGNLLFLLCTSDLPIILENTLVGYA